MTMLKLRIYDNGGKTIDRYTLILPDGEAWGFNDDPYHPQGFGQYAGSLAGLRSFSHLGKPVGIMDLPENARRFVDEVATTGGDTYVVTTRKGTRKRAWTGKPKSKRSSSRQSGTGLRTMRR